MRGEITAESDRGPPRGAGRSRGVAPSGHASAEPVSHRALRATEPVAETEGGAPSGVQRLEGAPATTEEGLELDELSTSGDGLRPNPAGEDDAASVAHA